MNEQGPPPSIQGMRVLLGPGDTASFPTRLARALSDRGAKCWVVDLAPHQYSAGADKLGKAKRWAPGLTRVIQKLAGGSGIAKALASAMKTLGQAAAFCWALWRVDALVLVSSRSLLPGYLDLPIYRLLGKRVIRVFLGTDSRPRYMTGWHHKVTDNASQPIAAKELARRVRRQRGRVRWMSRWASVVVENPLCGHYQQRPFINWFHVGFPHDPAFFDQAEASDMPSHDTPRPPRILHGPSNPQVKGTEHIEAAIDALKAQGIGIDYTRLTGMPHAEVLKQLRGCDLVIDQLYSDSPMAGFASEAAAFGKPAIVGGYGWESLQSRLGQHMPTNLLCKPDELEQTLRNAINDLQATADKGRAAQQFMNGYWHQDAVAERFARLLTGEGIDDDWCVDPISIDYWQGLGATDEHRRAVIKALVAQCGIDALGLTPGQAVYQSAQTLTERS